MTLILPLSYFFILIKLELKVSLLTNNRLINLFTSTTIYLQGTLDNIEKFIK